MRLTKQQRSCETESVFDNTHEKMNLTIGNNYCISVFFNWSASNIQNNNFYPHFSGEWCLLDKCPVFCSLMFKFVIIVIKGLGRTVDTVIKKPHRTIQQHKIECLFKYRVTVILGQASMNAIIYIIQLFSF